MIRIVLAIRTQDVEQAGQGQLYVLVRKRLAPHVVLTNEVLLGLPSPAMTSNFHVQSGLYEYSTSGKYTTRTRKTTCK